MKMFEHFGTLFLSGDGAPRQAQQAMNGISKLEALIFSVIYLLFVNPKKLSSF